MNICKLIMKTFRFLETDYGLKTTDKQLHGSYYFCTWESSITAIKVLYLCPENPPVAIFTYDADSLGTYADITEYRNEFACQDKSKKIQLQRAAEWLKAALLDGTIQL